MTIGRWLLMMLRIGIGFQLIVGIALWSGHGYLYVGVHRVVGIAFVCGLWAIALLALMRRQDVGLSAFAILWGLLIAALGITQQRLITGDFHWVIRTLHLGMGMAAMPMAERLARTARSPGSS